MQLSKMVDKLVAMVHDVEFDLYSRRRDWVAVQFNGHNLHAHVESRIPGFRCVIWRVDSEERETLPGIIEACSRPVEICWRRAL